MKKIFLFRIAITFVDKKIFFFSSKLLYNFDI
jgi:hypothetical protein